MEGKVQATKNKFLKLNIEKKEYNQYWFSEKTIDFIVTQIETQLNKHTSLSLSLSSEKTENNYKIAILCCPSVFFSLSKELQDQSYLFDIDEKLVKKHKNGVVYDFNNCEELKKQFDKAFDFVLIDPPFVVKDSWEKFAEFTNAIRKEGSCVLTCSLFENSELLGKLLGLTIRKYQPSIPHLVYQYNFYSNYENGLLDEVNDELN